MQTIQQQLVVPSDYHHQRVDSVLAQLLPEYSRSQLCVWIKAGAVRVNDHACKPKDKVACNDLITLAVDLDPPVDTAPLVVPEAISLDIAYEDEDVLVVNKPAGLVVHPGAGNPAHTLVNALVYHCTRLQQLPRAGIIHRLDKDTTGLLLVAKSLTAHTALTRQMQARTIQRHYLALVQGHLISGGMVDTGFGRHPRNRLKMAVRLQGRQAVTHYKIKKQYHEYTLLDVSLETGRTHQIRVHMAHLHHPVVGDALYGGRMRFPPKADDALRAALQAFTRQALHACALTFTHPSTQQTIALQAPVPADFQSLLTLLDAHYGV